MPILLKLFQELAEKGIIPSSFYVSTITLIPNPDKHNTKRKLQASMIDENSCKNPQQNFNKQNSATCQKAHTPWSSCVYSRDAGSIYTNKSMWYTILTNWNIKPCENLDRWRKSLWQHLAPIYKDGITNSMDMESSKFREFVMDRKAWRAAIYVTKSQTWLSDWTELNW